MLLPDSCINQVKSVDKKSIIVEYHEWCQKIDPPPLFCETPGELKLKAFGTFGTDQTYTYTSTSSVTDTSVSTATT